MPSAHLTSRREFLERIAVGAAAAMVVGGAPAEAAGDVYADFVLNTQDFSYPSLSIATVERVLDLHEAYGVALDVYLTTTMADIFAADAPDLLERLRGSRVATVNYHIRPPVPYYAGFDWRGVTQMTPGQQYDLVMDYETHRLDLSTGMPTEDEGGYQRLSDLVGYAPICVGDASEAALQAQVDGVFKALGASLVVVHGKAANLGDRRNGLLLRPEHVDLKLFQHVGEDVRTILTTALSEARAAQGGRAPFFIGVKMHDNDFFAEDSAWTTVYLGSGARRKRPPFDTTRRSPLLSTSDQENMWSLYASTVRYVASLGSRLPSVNCRRIADMARG